MSSEILRFEIPEHGIAVLTLNRPERLNALNGPLLDALADAIDDLPKPSIAVIVALALAHFNRCDDWSRDESLRFARLAPRWFGVGVDIAGKGARILGKT